MDTSVQPTGAEPVVDRFSPLYCLYNGVMLGQFLAAAFAAYARPGYGERRMRMQEFLDEIGAEVRLPAEPVTFGEPAYHRLVQEIVVATAARSSALAELALLGMHLVVHGHLVAVGDPTAADLAAEIERLRQEHGLPAPDLERLVPTLRDDGSSRIDEVLSPVLAYLAQAVRTLAVEPDTAFVIMPFAPPYAGYFASFYRPALEGAGCRAFRAWGGLSNEDYCDLLLALIGRCGLVWADVSDRNPNVFYETGAAHALGRPAVLVVHAAQAATVPANIGHDAVMRYDPQAADWPDTQVRALSLLLAAVRSAVQAGDSVRVGPRTVAAMVDAIGARAKAGLDESPPPSAADAAAAETALQEGLRALDAGDAPAAVRALDRAIALGRDGGEAFAHRARARLYAGDEEGALADLDEAVARGTTPAWAAHQMRGLLRNQRGDDAGAEADFSVVLEADPEQADTWFYRGMAREGLGRWAEALADFEQATRLGCAEAQMIEHRDALRAGRRPPET